MIITALAALLVLSESVTPAPAWRVDRGEVHVLCPLTVGGSFEARSDALAGSVTLATAHPTAFAGELAVDLLTLDTGIGLRNDHLRETYLEVGKGDDFARAVLSAIRLGEVDPATFQGHTTFLATLRLHGTSHTVVGQAEIRRDGSSVRVAASFPVTLADYGISKPQYLGIGVRSEVQVKVALVATPETEAR